MLKKLLFSIVVCGCLFFLACGLGSDDGTNGGKTGAAGFQDSGSFDANSLGPDFKLLEIFDGRGSLQDIWDSIDGTTFNDHFEDTVDAYPNAFTRSSTVFSDVLDDPGQPVARLLGTDLYKNIDILMDPSKGFRTGPAGINAVYDDTYAEGPTDYLDGFYSMLDALWEGDYRPGDQEIRDMGVKYVARTLDSNTPEQIQNDVQDVIDILTDERFDENFTLTAEVLGKALLQADYPIWADDDGNTVPRENINPAVHTNTGIGNAVKGVNDLAAWENRMLIDPTARDYFYTAIREAGKIFDPDPNSTNNLKLQALLTNLEDCFTVGGAVYESNPIYKSADTDPTYSDTELGETIRDLMPHTAQLLMRSDRPTSLIKTDTNDTPVYVLRETINLLKNIDYDPDDPGLETSLYNMLRYDQWGRDRTDPSSGAYDASLLDSLIFITNVAGNFGWLDSNFWESGVLAGESNFSWDPSFSHGHGEFCGTLTLNDSLISMRTGVWGSVSAYDSTMHDGDEERLFRSNKAFNKEDRDNYQFSFGPDSPVLHNMPGVCAGIMGTPDGGNRDGVPPGKNNYVPFNPTGLGEDQLGAWSVAWPAQACFGGEGPYYYEDPNAEIVYVDGKNYFKYLRPDGRVYALVNKDNPEWEYIYPTEQGDGEDPETEVTGYNGKRQRFNRFQSTFHSDYMMARFETYAGYDPVPDTEEFVTVEHDVDGNLAIVELSPNDIVTEDDVAGRLTFNELIPEDTPLHERACQSQEEALYRNYQWVYTEKKMVIILMERLFIAEGALGEGALFIVMEANGFSGLSNLRLFEDNHVWAKKGASGTSDIPGDYRCELVLEGGENYTPVAGVDDIYERVLTRGGHCTPSVVGRSLPSVYRLAFPLSPQMDRGNGVLDYELGSREFTVGDEIWQNRNAVMPPFVALLAALLNNTPSYNDGYDRDSLNCGIKGFINGVAPALQKPLVYYQRDGDYPEFSWPVPPDFAWTGVPFNTWKVRVQGTDHYGYWIGDNYLQPAKGFPGDPVWNGSEAENLYYQPATCKTLLNILTDSDITAPVAEGKRMDGLLPLVTETKTLSALVKALMSDANDSTRIDSALEQIVGAVKYTQGTMTAIDADPAANKNIVYPNWMFATGYGSGDFGEYIGFYNVRDEDIILDKILDTVIGHDSLPDKEGYGLADYVDTQETTDNWKDFNHYLDIMEDFLYPESPYSLLESFIGSTDAIFARETPYTDEQIAGLIYGMGKLFTYYDTDTGRWVVQGEPGFDGLYKTLNARVPAIHELIKDDDGTNYTAMLIIGEDMLKDNGQADYLLDAMSTNVNARGILEDLHTFLADDIVRDSEPLWETLSQLLADLAVAVDQSSGGAALDDVYDSYGFQIND
ncbi:hypothetical protein [Desulfosudis oleivorans]|uniref:Uncharacterized protein n=1 Tax=Desulfosudis oleivorans (strain DSM 6200 / JCM 39069 / Hxd3) TaxID=96561 RepID=A8ZT64_DESOH|nr:hypothetical protein [Desulfosudis oleivorans]ABW67747.1 hypothetical protein Dole_1943 [Desulfosudis oleivorans Hxd3]